MPFGVAREHGFLGVKQEPEPISGWPRRNKHAAKPGGIGVSPIAVGPTDASVIDPKRGIFRRELPRAGTILSGIYRGPKSALTRGVEGPLPGKSLRAR
jgi:hypothetical protein